GSIPLPRRGDLRYSVRSNTRCWDFGAAWSWWHQRPSLQGEREPARAVAGRRTRSGDFCTSTTAAKPGTSTPCLDRILGLWRVNARNYSRANRRPPTTPAPAPFPRPPEGRALDGALPHPNRGLLLSTIR